MNTPTMSWKAKKVIINDTRKYDDFYGWRTSYFSMKIPFNKASLKMKQNVFATSLKVIEQQIPWAYLSFCSMYLEIHCSCSFMKILHNTQQLRRWYSFNQFLWVIRNFILDTPFKGRYHLQIEIICSIFIVNLETQSNCLMPLIFIPCTSQICRHTISCQSKNA